MAAPGFLDRRRHHLFEHREIDVAETLDVQAPPRQLVFADYKGRFMTMVRGLKS